MCSGVTRSPRTRDYVATSEDNGGVHINSGIPNKAFHLVATALGGHAWERAGRIWYLTVTGGTLRRTADFAAFAAATTQTAQRSTVRLGGGRRRPHRVERRRRDERWRSRLTHAATSQTAIAGVGARRSGRAVSPG
jgi:hypothetical protein